MILVRIGTAGDNRFGRLDERERITHKLTATTDRRWPLCTGLSDGQLSRSSGLTAAISLQLASISRKFRRMKSEFVLRRRVFSAVWGFRVLSTG